MVITDSKKYLREISFQLLENWSVQYLKGADFSYNKKFSLIAIGDFLTRNKDGITIEDEKEYERVTVKMKNKGVCLRDKEKGVNIGTKKQFLAHEGQFIMSKIDARNGAFGIIPQDLNGAIVTNDFPTFNIDQEKINPQFFVSLISTTQFLHFAQSCSSGTTGRQRMDMDLFLKVKIPLPPLHEQNAMVKAYNEKIYASVVAEERAENLEQNIEVFLMEELGIEPMDVKEKEKNGLQEVRFKDLDIWGFENKQLQILSQFKSVKYEKYKISEICKIGSGGTPNRSHNKYYKGLIPWIKTGEVRENIITDTEEKITELGMEKSSAKLFPKGSLILAMYGATAGRSAKLGISATTNQACAVLFDFIENVNVDFFWFYLQYQIDNFKGIATGSAQPNLSAEKIKKYPVPLPPLSIQEKIVEKISAMKAEIKRLKIFAEEKRSSAILDFEGEIFI